MPYILPANRDEIDASGLTALCADLDMLPAGSLAYIAYRILLAAAPRGSRFETRNAAMGAMLEAVAEYRRYIHEPAEDYARAKNGDIQ